MRAQDTSKDVPLLASPEELAGQRFLMLEAFAAANGRIELFCGNEAMLANIAGPVVTNSLGFLRALTLSGAGIGAIPVLMCEEAEKRGDLVKVLPDWRPPAMDSHYVIPTRTFIPASVSRFIEMLDEVAFRLRRLPTTAVPDA